MNPKERTEIGNLKMTLIFILVENLDKILDLESSKSIDKKNQGKCLDLDNGSRKSRSRPISNKDKMVPK